MTYENTVVVAVDEGAPDPVLLRWAAEEAAHRGTRLVVCHVDQWQPGQQAPVPLTEDVAGDPATGPDRVVRAALDAVRAEYPRLRVSGAVGIGNPAAELLAVSEEPAMIVVGARGVGGFAGLLMGSISGQVAENARCPVAVVRPAVATATDVVVGVDGSQEARRALRLGLIEARRTGGTLIALHAYRLPPVAAAYAINPGVEKEFHRDLAEQTLAAIVRHIEAENADVKIEPRVEHGPTAAVLLDAAVGAAVLVVGARGLGGFAGLVTGSTSQQVLRHAPCPVLVAH